MSLDTVLEGGRLLTMDPKVGLIEGPIHIRGARIASVGSRLEGEARVIDARGAVIMPGFVQAHVHLCQTLMRGMAEDLPLMRWLKERVWPLEAAHSPDSLAASARLGLAEMLLGGTTSILDMGTVHHHDVVFEAMRDSGIRGRSGKSMVDRGEGMPPEMVESRRQSLRSSEALASRWEGAGDGRLGYAFSPRFILSCTEALLRDVAGAAADTRALVHTHAAEHAEERRAVRELWKMEDVAALASCGLRGPRMVLAHGVHLEPQEMLALAEERTRVVHCPSANLKLASGIADVRAMQRAGIQVGLGADGAPCNNRMDPFTELRLAALLAKVKTGDAGALSAISVLEIATRGGAEVLGIGDETGSLEVGKRADLIVVSVDELQSAPGGDVATRLVYAAERRDVRHVFIDGRHIVSEGELLTLDVNRVHHDAKRHARALASRI